MTATVQSPAYEYITSAEAMSSALAELGSSLAIALDTETAKPRDPVKLSAYDNVYNRTKTGELAPFDPYTSEVRLIQMKGEGTGVFVIDLWSLSAVAKAYLASWMESYAGVFICHNAKFELRHLRGTLGVWIDHTASIFDTQQASVLLANSVGMGHARGHGLLDVCRDFLDVIVDKEEQKSDWSLTPLTQEQKDYAATDVIHLHALQKFFKNALVKKLGQAIPLALEMGVIGPTARMEWNGLPFSREVYEKVQEAARYALPELLSKIGRYFKDTIGAKITAQRIGILKADGTTEFKTYLMPYFGGKSGSSLMNARPKIKAMLQEMGLVDDEGEPIDSTQRADLEAYKVENPGVGYLLDYWALFKQTQFSYADYVHPLTGRCHPTFIISGAGTGRFSSKNFNAQQIPTKMVLTHPHTGTKLNFRYCFKAEDLPSLDAERKSIIVSNLIHAHDHDNDILLVASCVTGDALIATPDGLRRADTIEVGHSVETQQGARVVLGLKVTPGREVKKAVSTLGFSVKATPDHKFLTVSGAEFEYRPLEALSASDWLVLQKDFIRADVPLVELPGSAYPAHHAETPVSIPTHLDVPLGEFLGRFMGDGCVIKGNRTVAEPDKLRSVSLALGSDVDELLPEFDKLTTSLFGRTFAEKGRGDVKLESTRLAIWLKDVTQKGDVRELAVPSCVLQSGRAVVGAFLRGLFDADGSVSVPNRDNNRRTVSAWITSETMADQVQLLLLGLGIVSRKVRTSRTTNFGYIEGSVITVCEADAVRKFADEVGFVTKRKQQRLVEQVAVDATLRTRNYSYHIPAGLVLDAFRGRQRGKLNNLIGNSRRNGHVTHQALANAFSVYPDAFDAEKVARMLNPNILFDRLTDVSGTGAETVYDFTIDDVHHFLANGLVVHNCDFSGQELTVMAKLSGDQLMIDTINNDGDLHSEAAAGMFGIDPKNARDPIPGLGGITFRDRGKIIMFSLAYGKTAKGFALAFGITEAEAKKLIAGFKKRFKALTDWLEYEGNLAAAQGFSVLANGAIRFLGGDSDRNGKTRQGANYQIQGLSSWATRRAMITLDEDIKLNNYPIWPSACIHDELLSTLRASIHCPYARWCLGLDEADKALKVEMKAAKDAKDKAAEKALEKAIEARRDQTKVECEPACVDRHCATRYHNVIGAAMKAGAVSVLEGVVKPGYDLKMAGHWSH